MPYGLVFWSVYVIRSIGCQWTSCCSVAELPKPTLSYFKKQTDGEFLFQGCCYHPDYCGPTVPAVLEIPAGRTEGHFSRLVADMAVPNVSQVAPASAWSRRRMNDYPVAGPLSRADARRRRHKKKRGRKNKIN